MKNTTPMTAIIVGAIVAALVIGAFVLGQKHDEGPAEKLGKSVDKAAEDIQKGIDNNSGG